MKSRGSLTSHGTPYLYDRQVPIVFMMPGTPATRSGESIATVDIAPTIAGLLDISVPDSVDGENRTSYFSPSPAE